jgi:hypothetical protein
MSLPVPGLTCVNKLVQLTVIYLPASASFHFNVFATYRKCHILGTVQFHILARDMRYVTRLYVARFGFYATFYFPTTTILGIKFLPNSPFKMCANMCGYTVNALGHVPRKVMFHL